MSSSDAFPAMESGPVVVAGAAGIDLLGHQAQAGTGADSVPGTVQRSPGGVARNIAETLARLHHPVRLVSLVGSDDDGERLLASAVEAGIDVSFVQRSAELPTSAYLAVHDHRGRMTAAVSDMRLCESLSGAHLDAALAAVETARAVVLDANLTEGTLRRLSEACAAAPLFADAVSAVKAPRLAGVLARLHTLKLTLAEARALVGEPRAEWHACCQRLMRRGVQRVVVSLGEAGIGYCDAERRLERSAPRCRVRGDTGAGDALTAGLVAAWLEGLALEAQLDYALGCAGMTLECTTAVPAELTAARVRAWIEEHQ